MPTIIQLQDNRDIKNEDYLLIEQDKSRKVNIDTLISYIKKMTAVKDLDNNTTLNGSDCFLISQDKDRKVTLNDLTEKINKSLDITTFNSTSDLNNNNFILIGQSNATSSATKKVSLDNLSTKVNSNMNLNNFDSVSSVNNTDFIMLGQDKARKVTVNDLSNKINSNINLNNFDSVSSVNNTDFIMLGQDKTRKVTLNDLSNKINSNMNLTQFESTAILNNSDYLMLGRQDKIRRITMQTLYTSIRSVLNIDDLENRINGVITTVGEGKQLISTAINNKGGNADASDTFYTLSQKINGLNINGFVEKDNKFYEIIINDNNVELYSFYPVITGFIDNNYIDITIKTTFYKETHEILLYTSYGTTINKITEISNKGTINTKISISNNTKEDKYIIKVLVNGKTFTKTIEITNEIRGTWVNTRRLLRTTHRLAGETFSNGSFTAMGGYKSTGCYEYNTMYVPSTNSWTYLAHMPYPLQGLMSVINSNDEIFTVGGIDSDGIVRGYTSCYSKSTNKWTSKYSTLPVSEGVCEISNNIIYVLGGRRSSGLNDYVFIYNTLTNTWSYGISYSMRLCNTCSALYDNKIYIFGGLNSYDTAQSSVYVYNIATSTLTTLPNMNTAIHGAGSCIIDGLIYITGGKTANKEIVNTVSCYDVKTNSWLECTPLKEGRYNHLCLASEEKVYVLAGMTNSGYSETAECFTRSN